MTHRADNMNDIFEHDVAVRGNLSAKSGNIQESPVSDSDIVNKKYADTLAANHPHQNVNTAESPTFANLLITSGGDIKPSADSTTTLNIAQADGTNFIIFDTTNKRMGIGITSPVSKLHVNNGTSGQMDVLWITGGNASGVGQGGTIVFNTGSSSYPTWRMAEIRSTYRNVANYESDLTFWTNTGATATNTTEKVRINGDGKVGIGKTAAAYLLEVNGEIQGTGYRSSDGSAGASGNFTTVDLKTVTVKNGIITSIV